MKQLLIILLFSMSSFCNAQKKPQPQFIKFMAEYAHPELLLADYRPLYISTVALNLPLPDNYAKIIEHEKKLKPTMSAKELDQIKNFYLGSLYLNLIIDKKPFDLLHDYILRNSKFFVIKPCKPACLIVVDNKNRYLPQNKMKIFYKGLKIEFISKKCDTSILSEIADQFTLKVE
jgi:hypothetical protein